jgi:hypothetical protein
VSQTRSFTCVIDDKVLNDLFSANVTVGKRGVIRKSLDGRTDELADVFITPISGQHGYYGNKNSWDKTPARFNVPTRDNNGSHNHFIVTDVSGGGLYIVRDRMRREVHRRECSIFDLGAAFAEGVMNAVRELA